MTAHLHSSLVRGCYRCELNRDEATAPYDRVALIDAIESVVGRWHRRTGLITEIADAVVDALDLNPE